jgi:PAS domain S-box-containing protein
MNETATWPGVVPDLDGKKDARKGTVSLFFSILLVGLGLGGVVWMRYSHMGEWIIGTTAAPVLGIAGFLLGRRAAMLSWQDRLIERLKDRDMAWRKGTAGIRTQLADARRMEEELKRGECALREEFHRVSESNAQMHAELNSLKRAEKNLSQQRQSLEVSKSVLELHVEARTKEVQKLQRRYEHILNSAGEGICGLDLEGRTTFANPAVAKLTGWKVEELIGQTEQEIFGLHGPAEGNGSVQNNPGEEVFHRKDGTPYAVEYVRTDINENGRVMGSVLIVKDITERKRADETLAQRAAELARSNAELEQFAFVASHDLQEPLRKIQAFGDRLKMKCQGAIAAEAHDYLQRMQNAAARMRTLIDDLLAFSRVIRSSEPFIPVDLVKVTKEVLSDLEVRIEQSAARVEVGDLPTIQADPLQMRQLLLNLLNNALKFQPPDAQPVVMIQSRTFNQPSGEEMCELTVSDNGIGFEEIYLEKIFAVFQRLHGRTEYEGTGVGLAVCRRITDRHHGTITAKSQLGQGSTFIVTLPMRQPEEQPIK